MNKYIVWCNQRQQYYGAENDIQPHHFNSLKEIKDMLIDYHFDIDEKDHKALYKMGATEIAEAFGWTIQEVKAIQ